MQSIIHDPNEKFSISSLFIATLSGGLSEGMKAPGTVVISTAGAGIDSVISGKNPLPPMIGAAGGSLGGYYLGYGVEKLGGKYINPWKNGFKDYRDPVSPSIINPPKVSPIPSI
ncbi:hypothetical protein KSI86_20525 [Dickeya oryzae]|uniref:hypothetical protein n=1 Tax=Dickeya oryzae TaxID=1240404 RepID=UPI002097B653|nr:hypothetical protein [Dickeya oryzae]MCO7256544.1 hypothetical protein [Dickeya oryzae]